MTKQGILDYFKDINAMYNNPNMLDSLSNMIDELLTAKDINVPTKWVSVKDRLPEENEAVNVVWVNHNPVSYYQHIKDKPLVATAVYYDGRWYWWNTTISDYLNEYGHVEFDRIDEGIEITHWQNLPEPPKEKRE